MFCKSKRLILAFFPVLLALVANNYAAGEYQELINTGKWTSNQLDVILVQSSRITDTSVQIDFISRQFLNVPYEEETLAVDIHRPEVLVVNLSAVDCFTYIDYVEAMRLSKSFNEFKGALKKVRYKNGIVAYNRRNHFFTDWIESNNKNVEDVTEQIGGDNTKKSIKILNYAVYNKQALSGEQNKKREISYIPAEAINEAILRKLKTGDYVGVYSNRQNLDVSHVGIVIRKETALLFRHASAQDKHRRVVEEGFIEYMSMKPGIVILRPLSIK